MKKLPPGVDLVLQLGHSGVELLLELDLLALNLLRLALGGLICVEKK